MEKPREPGNPRDPKQGMLPEYRFDYTKARPNRFSVRLRRGSRAVVLESHAAPCSGKPGVD